MFIHGVRSQHHVRGIYRLHIPLLGQQAGRRLRLGANMTPQGVFCSVSPWPADAFKQRGQRLGPGPCFDRNSWSSKTRPPRLWARCHVQTGGSTHLPAWRHRRRLDRPERSRTQRETAQTPLGLPRTRGSFLGAKTAATIGVLAKGPLPSLLNGSQP